MTNGGRTIRLPAAPPADYLRWMAFWRDVERRMTERPALERFASEEAAPFLHGREAAAASQAAAHIVEQAHAAERAGDRQVSPSIFLRERSEKALADLIEIRGAWVDSHADALGLAPLSPDLIRLRAAVVTALRAAGTR